MSTKPISLALQGGGAHGAFGWGVLDYLLEDGRLNFEAVTATSAGAMNAAALAYGLVTGGNEKAREVLENFWQEIANVGAFYAPVKNNTPMDMMQAMNPFMPKWDMGENLAFQMFQTITSSVSPYQFNPMNINPLRDVLEKTIDFDAVHACDCIKIFINATNVRNGNATVFENKDVTIDTLLASSALPFLFQAVEIEDEHYWDGGYMGNPSLWPLFYKTECRDILMVHINPIIRDELPTEAYQIENRMNEITFNAAFLKELRAIDFVRKLINEDMLKDEYKEKYKDVLLHAVRADEAMRKMSIASKFDTDWTTLTSLRDQGRAEAEKWLKTNFKHIGKKPTVDIQKDYLET